MHGFSCRAIPGYISSGRGNPRLHIFSQRSSASLNMHGFCCLPIPSKLSTRDLHAKLRQNPNNGSKVWKPSTNQSPATSLNMRGFCRRPIPSKLSTRGTCTPNLARLAEVLLKISHRNKSVDGQDGRTSL